MPTSPPRRCPIPGCTSFTPPRQLCKEHETEKNAQRRKRETWRDYGSEWQRVRRAALEAQPQCQRCGKPATDVDHIKPLRDGGTHEASNLRCLCHSCHSKRTWQDTIGKSIEQRREAGKPKP